MSPTATHRLFMPPRFPRVNAATLSLFTRATQRSIGLGKFHYVSNATPRALGRCQFGGALGRCQFGGALFQRFFSISAGSLRSAIPAKQGTALRKAFSSQQSWPSPSRRPGLQQKSQVTRDGYSHFGGQQQGKGSGSRINSRYILGFTVTGMGMYIYANLDYAPFTGRVRILGISRKQEMALGKETFVEVLRSFNGRILPPQHPESVRVRRVVSKIARTVKRMDGKLSEGFEWQVVVAVDNEANALCVPGGRILITTGLLEILPTDEDVAVVVAHEIAHALNRHGAESMHLHRMLVPLIIIANQVLDMRWVPGIIAKLFLSLPYSRSLEREADEVGLQLCVECCYNPGVAPGVFKRLAALESKGGGLSGTKLGPFLSTHPPTKERERRLKASAIEKEDRYKMKCMTGPSFPGFVRDFNGGQFTNE